MVRAAELLLARTRPAATRGAGGAQATRSDEATGDAAVEPTVVRQVDDPRQSRSPASRCSVDLPYTVMVTQRGGGYSRYESLAVTRWRADGTRDDTGQFCYVRDIATARRWSVGLPADGGHRRPVSRALRHRTGSRSTAVDGDIETRTEIVVVPEDAAEVRRVTLTNHGSEVRDIELTSYGEVVLASAETDRGPSCLRQPLRGDGVARVVCSDHRAAAAAPGGRAGALVCARG